MPLMIASASAGTYDGITSALTTSAQQVANSALSAIAGVVPIALTVMGAGVVIGVGIKIFKTVVRK